MGFMEIAIPTGMEADIDSMNTTSTYGLYKKKELQSDQLDLYFDWVRHFFNTNVTLTT